MNNRKNKLIALRQYIDLETGDILTKNKSSILLRKIMRKKTLDRDIMACNQCDGLNIKSSTRAVPGWGNLNAKIFFIGESPCIHSMIASFPFSHKSGRVLDIILALSGLTRYDVFVADSIHCHPVNDRNPTTQELECCSAFLQKEIDIVRPKLIMPLGTFAKMAVSYIDTLKCKVMPVTHPAYFLYKPRGIKDYIIKLSIEIDKYK